MPGPTDTPTPPNTVKPIPTYLDTVIKPVNSILGVVLAVAAIGALSASAFDGYKTYQNFLNLLMSGSFNSLKNTIYSATFTSVGLKISSNLVAANDYKAPYKDTVDTVADTSMRIFIPAAVLLLALDITKSVVSGLAPNR